MQQTPPPYRGDVTEPPTGERRSSRRTSSAQRWLIAAFAVASGAVAAVAARAVGDGTIARHGAFGLAAVEDPLPLLNDLADRGVRAAAFEGLDQR